MNETDSIDPARKRKRNKSPPVPIMRTGELFALHDLHNWFSRRSVTQWIAEGLIVLRPSPKSAFVLSDDLIAFFKQQQRPKSCPQSE